MFEKNMGWLDRTVHFILGVALTLLKQPRKHKESLSAVSVKDLTPAILIMAVG